MEDEKGPVIDELDNYELRYKFGRITVHGRRFISSDKVIIDGKAYPTTFVSTIRLFLDVKKSNNMRPGTYGLSVGNLQTEGRRSNVVWLTVG